MELTTINYEMLRFRDDEIKDATLDGIYSESVDSIIVDDLDFESSDGGEI